MHRLWKGGAALFLLGGGILLLACNDEDRIIPPIQPEKTGRESPEELIEGCFVSAYSTPCDSAKYEACLGTNYLFFLLDDDIGELPEGGWDKKTELDIASTMFNARYNEENMVVRNIALDLMVKTKSEDNEDYDYKEAGEVWYKIITDVDLVVTAENPNDPDGFTNYVVLSQQDFRVRPDPDDDALWVIHQQHDMPPIQ